MNSVFWLWIVLAVLFLALAMWALLSGIPIRRDLKELAKEGPHSSLQRIKKPDIELNDTVYKAFNAIFITNLIGFILASGAAILSAF